jgi:hypothetical protein
MKASFNSNTREKAKLPETEGLAFEFPNGYTRTSLVRFRGRPSENPLHAIPKGKHLWDENSNLRAASF